MTSTEPLALTAAVRDALLDHAGEGAARDPPAEVCGVLSGTRGPPDRVTDAHRVDNVAAHPRSEYELDPEATVATMDRLEAAGEEAVGFYHSHPESPARPSATDRARATWTGYVYAIVSPPETIRAYRFTGEGFDELPVQVESRE
ncbi:desampylase [Haloplanus halophilus]|uniref:desampylase n=1 Tax=Haloplanus halophilus TaxID=2949993 RepID=UPI00203F91E6|nr:desampylase [Haloplanus sp. GDY1]